MCLWARALGQWWAPAEVGCQLAQAQAPLLELILVLWLALGLGQSLQARWLRRLVQAQGSAPRTASLLVRASELVPEQALEREQGLVHG